MTLARIRITLTNAMNAEEKIRRSNGNPLVSGISTTPPGTWHVQKLPLLLFLAVFHGSYAHISGITFCEIGKPRNVSRELIGMHATVRHHTQRNREAGKCLAPTTHHARIFPVLQSVKLGSRGISRLISSACPRLFGITLSGIGKPGNVLRQLLIMRAYFRYYNL